MRKSIESSCLLSGSLLALTQSHGCRAATVPKWARAKVHRLLYHSSLGLRVLTKRKKQRRRNEEVVISESRPSLRHAIPDSASRHALALSPSRQKLRRSVLIRVKWVSTPVARGNFTTLYESLNRFAVVQGSMVFLQNNFRVRLCWELEEPKGPKGTAPHNCEAISRRARI